MSDLPLPNLGVPVVNNELHVRIHREMFSDFFTIMLDDNSSEELEIEPLREWFKVRGANMDSIDKVLDHVWNFGYAEVLISNPKTPKHLRLPHEPDI
jgi:hypothetical protein